MQTELSLATVAATQEQVDALLHQLLPAQGQWSAAAYRWLTDHTACLIECTDCLGCPRLRSYLGRVV